VASEYIVLRRKRNLALAKDSDNLLWILVYNEDNQIVEKFGPGGFIEYFCQLLDENPGLKKRRDLTRFIWGYLMMLEGEEDHKDLQQYFFGEKTLLTWTGRQLKIKLIRNYQGYWLVALRWNYEMKDWALSNVMLLKRPEDYKKFASLYRYAPRLYREALEGVETIRKEVGWVIWI